MINPKYGYVMLYRDLINWEWYSEPNTFRLYIHCLLCANYKSKQWKGITIEAGSFVTSLKKLSEKLSISKRKIETALKHLILSHYLLYKSTNKYSIITVTDYDKYQTNVIQNVNQMLHKCETNVKQMCTTNKDKKDKKDKKDNYDVKKIFQKLREETMQNKF